MFRRIHDVNQLWKAWRHYEDIRKEVETTMETKALLKSKTFWLNLLGLAGALAGVLPQKWAVPVLAISNIGMRLVTNQPVGLFKDK